MSQVHSGMAGVTSAHKIHQLSSYFDIEAGSNRQTKRPVLHTRSQVYVQEVRKECNQFNAAQPREIAFSGFTAILFHVCCIQRIMSDQTLHGVPTEAL